MSPPDVESRQEWLVARSSDAPREARPDFAPSQ
jgi:hypothetical protein